MDLDNLIEQSGGELSPNNAARVLDMALYPDDYAQDGQPETDAAQTTQAADVAENATAETKHPETEQGQPETKFESGQPENKQPEQLSAKDIEALAAAQVEQRLAQQSKTPEPPAKTQSGQPEQQVLQNLAEQSGLSDDELRELFGDFSEKSMANAVQKLTELAVEKRLAAFEQRIASRLQPIESKQERAALSEHYQKIYAAVPDADAIVQGGEWGEWLQAQPSFARAAIENVMQNGATQDVIDVFAQFKAARKQPESVVRGQPETRREAAKQAEQKQPEKQNPPDTLSGFPASRSSGVSQFESLKEMGANGLGLASRLSEMNPSQIEQYLNSL